MTTIMDRTVPVAEDLTTEEHRLQVLRGLEKAHRVDKPYATGETFEMGEWAVLNADGKCERASATPAVCYLVFSGTDRWDSKATGQVTIFMATQLIVKTTKYDASATYAVNDLLTVKDLGASESHVTRHTAGEVAVAKVVEVGTDYLVYETMSPVAIG